MSEESRFDKEKSECSKEMRKNRFTEEDDKKILELLKEFPGKWDKIGKILNRDKRSCKERYQHYLLPIHSTWHWTTEEKLQLIYLKAKLNYSWDEINKVFPSRGPKTIKNQWYYLSKKPLVQALIGQMKNFKRTISRNKLKNKEVNKSITDFSDVYEVSDFEFTL